MNHDGLSRNLFLVGQLAIDVVLSAMKAESFISIIINFVIGAGLNVHYDEQKNNECQFSNEALDLLIPYY
jgi:hypothetical protein